MENKTQTDGKAKYPHFNPTKYDLQVKISGVKTSSHSKHNLNYHFVWIPKYRKRLLSTREGQKPSECMPEVAEEGLAI